MKKLEQQLLSYLPYKLKGQLIHDLRDDFGSEDWVEDIEIFNEGAIWIYAGYADADLVIPLGEGDFSGFLIKQEKGTYTSVGKSIKPILRPLSDLTNEHIEDLYFKFEKSETDASSWESELRMLRKYKGTNYSLPLSWWNYLYEMHYDIHGLIDQGLAIDINTLSQPSQD